MMNRHRRIWIAAAALAMAAAGPGWAGDWPHWRGPHFTGAADEADAPATWEAPAWKAPLPGPAGSTPIVTGSRVLVSSTVADSAELVAMCLDAGTGKVQWRRTVGEPQVQIRRNEPASASPVTDGRRVFFTYATGLIGAFDLEGEALWTRELSALVGPFNVQFGYSSSPLLLGERLIVQVLRARDPYRDVAGDGPFESLVVVLDAATGEEIARQVRLTEAVRESRDAYTSPIPWQGPAGLEVLVLGGDALTGHDPGDLSEKWRFEFNLERKPIWRIIPSPVPGDALVYMSLPRGGNDLVALRPDGSATPPVAWRFAPQTPDVCTPLLYQGRLYVLDGNRRRLSCLDAGSGEPAWQSELEARSIFRASPMGAGGKVYCLDMTGRLFVVAAGDEFELLGRHDLAEGKEVRSSPVAAAGRLFFRTDDELICVEK